MGSICCVPARSQTTTGSINTCSNIVDDLHCCGTNGFSPPSVSQQWGKHEHPGSHSLQTDGTLLSPTSSRGSRIGSRAGSAGFISDRYTPSDSSFSHGASPADNQWTSLISSRSGNFAEFLTHTGVINSSPSIALSSQKEGVTFTGFSPLTSTPESNASCKQDDYGVNRYMSKGSRRLSRSRNKGVGLNLGFVDNTPDWWSMQMFSELVASSRRERMKWSRARSPSDFGYIVQGKSMEKGASYGVEQIRAYSSEAVSGEHCAETHKCGLCSRLLSDISAHSHSASDLAVVGVLSCGHVFHSCCLEEFIPEARKQDPPCPQCDPADSVKAKKVPKLLASKGGWIASSFHGQTSSRNKLSRIVAADSLSEQELSCCPLDAKGKVPVLGDTCEKLVSSSSMDHHEKV